MSSSRVHYLDAARAMLMLLGIPYHAGLIYTYGNEWPFATSPVSVSGIGYFSEWIHFWRMPAFFVVAGFFASFMIIRLGQGPWLKNRFIKLGVPMLATLILLNPWPLIIQNPPEFYQIGDHWMAHLWFLPTLLACCTVVAIIPTRWVGRVLIWGNFRPKTTLILFLVFATVMSGMGSMMGKHIPIDVVFFRYFAMTTVGYFAFFLMGYVGFLNQKANAWLTRNSTKNTAVFLAGSAYLVYTDWSTFWPNIFRVFVLTIVGISATRWVFGMCRIFFDRPEPSVRRVVDASFTIYLVHFPLLTVLWHPLHMLKFEPRFEFVVLCTVTLLISYMLHGFIVRHRTLLFLFNGTRNPTKENPNGATRFGD